MLTLYHSRAGRGERPANLAEESLPENVAWIDLLRPQPDEVAFVKRTTGLDVPSIADLSEIESSSRLRNQNGAIYLSAPLGLSRRFRPAADDPGRLCANARAADHGALRRAELVHYVRQPGPRG